MKKRRRLANKMTIMVCAVLIAVSAFFYAPMEVSAEEYIDEIIIDSVDSMSVEQFSEDYSTIYDASSDLSVSSSERVYFKFLRDVSIGSLQFSFDNINSDSYYKVVVSSELSGSDTQAVNLVYPYVTWNGYYLFNNSFWGQDPVSETDSRSFILKGSELLSSNNLLFSAFFFRASSAINTVYSIDFEVNVDSIVELSSTSSDDYQNGYNAGYSAGESAGYSNGYSQGFTDGEASVDTDAIYDEAFQAGKDSVDTQSYYDAGYQAGYQVAYQEGYDSGYDEGYQSAMDRIASWGADMSEYPILITESGETFDLQFDFIESGSDDFVYSDYHDAERYYTGIEFNPNHTYRLDFTYHDFTYDYDSFFTASYSFWLYWGDSAFPLVVGSKDDITTSVFIPGDRISNGLRFRCDLGQIESNGSIDTLHYYLTDCYLKLYDMGPSGDTQNHIANQTDQLTNGYDTSSGDSGNSSLSTGLNEYETAENSLFATATTGMKDFTFFDFESVPAMLTAVTFITSIMGSWFEQAGGASGVGIVLSILFSVMLVSMVLGLYRLYQSAGHRAEARQAHRESMERWKKGK